MSPNPNWILHLQSLGWDAAAKIAVAALLGAVVSLERAWGGHQTGLRTNMLMEVRSCLFTILSIDGFPLQGSRYACETAPALCQRGSARFCAGSGQCSGVMNPCHVPRLRPLRKGSS